MNPDLSSGGSMQFTLAPDVTGENSGKLPTSPQSISMPAPVAPHPPGGVGGFLARNAQTIGSIGGGIIGGAVGLPANLLDLIGIPGTAADVATAVGGAAIGGDIGQRVKNTFDPTESTNPEKEGAIGGASELAGLGTGRLVSKAAPALKGMAADVFKNAFNIPAKLAGRLDPEGTAAKIMNYGIGGSLHKMVGASQNALDMLDNIYRNSIGQIGKQIDTSPMFDAVERFIKSPTTTELTDTDIGKIRTLINNTDIPGKAPFLMDPQDAVDRMRALQDAGHTLVAKGVNRLNPNPRLEQIGSAYLSAGDTLQNLLDEAGGKASVNALKTPQIIKQLSTVSPKLAQEFQDAKTPQQIRTLMSPFVRLKTMARITMESPRKGKLLANILGAGGGFGIGGVLGAIVGGMVGSPIIEGIERNIAAPVATGAGRLLNAAGGAVEKVAGSAAIPALGMTGEDLAAKTVSLLTGNKMEGPQPPVAQPGMTPVSTLIDNMVSKSIPQQMPGASQGLPPITNLDEYQTLLNQVGQKGVDNYLALQRQESPQISDKQQQDWMNNQNAVIAVQDFAQLFDQVKASGAVAGGLEELGTKIPGIQNIPSEAALKAYEDNKGDLASTLAQVLGGGRGSKALLVELKSELPDINDSPAAASMKLSKIIDRLGANMNTVVSAPATNTPGQLTNFTGQSVPGQINFSNPNLVMPGQ